MRTMEKILVRSEKVTFEFPKSPATLETSAGPLQDFDNEIRRIDPHMWTRVGYKHAVLKDAALMREVRCTVVYYTNTLSDGLLKLTNAQFVGSSFDNKDKLIARLLLLRK